MKFPPITPEEQAENKKKWVAALRSGKYSQVRSRLKTANGYCCLGVACEVLDAKVNLVSSDGSVYYHHDLAGIQTVTYTILPYIIAHKLGISPSGTFDPINGMSFRDCLWKLNDFAGYSFSEIADFIEENEKSLTEKGYIWRRTMEDESINQI